MPFNKIGLQYMPPIWLTFFRCAGGAIVIFLVAALTKRLTLPRREDLPFIFSIGIFQIGGLIIFSNYGMMFVNAGRASILLYSTPLWVTPFAILIFGEKLTLQKLLGLLLGLAGIGILFSPASFNWSDPKVILGNGLLLLASLCWAATMLHVRYGKSKSAPLTVLPWQLLVACVPSLILAPLTEPFSQIHWTKPLIGVILYNGIVATAFAYWASITISRVLPVITSSLSLLAIPILSLIVANILLGEKMTTGEIIAVGFIISGLACLALESRFKKQTPDSMQHHTILD